MNRKFVLAFSIPTAAVLMAAGCQRGSDYVAYDEAPAGDSAAAAHNHPSEGPHHGDLVELGDEEYHAEVVHDEAAGMLTVYILDGEAKQQVAIDATEVTINVSHNGAAEQFALAAAPEESDGEGQSSRFASNSEELAAHLDEHGAEPQLVVMIDGKSYRGTIHHGHDHDDGHDDNGDDAGHGHEAGHE